MFESCQKQQSEGHKCSDVAEKLVHLFGWRQTYKVEKLQRSLTIHGKEGLHKSYSSGCSSSTVTAKPDAKKCLSFDDACVKDAVPHRYSQQFQRNKFQKSYLSLNSSGRVSNLSPCASVPPRRNQGGDGHGEVQTKPYCSYIDHPGMIITEASITLN